MTTILHDGGIEPHEARESRPPIELYFGRDASLLEFNRRVLAQAEDSSYPLLERVKFMTILASNLDEFFMKRIALLKRRAEMRFEKLSHDGRTVQQQLQLLRSLVIELQQRQSDCLHQMLLPALRDEGIRIAPYEGLSDHERARVDEWYAKSIFPVLTPLAVDPGHRFPFISNLSESLGVLLSQPDQRERDFARLKIPDGIPRLVPISDGAPIGEVENVRDVRLVPLDQIIRHNLGQIFPGMEIVEVLEFRVTRSTGLNQDEEEVENLLQHVEDEVRQRRFADPVRIETGPDPSASLLDLLLDELELEPADVYTREGPLDYRDLESLLELDRADLKPEPWLPVIPTRLRGEDTDIFSVIRERDVLVHHPYESFQATVERFIATAAADPNVLAIKQTLYRTSRDSPFIDSLIRAAEDGKAVACLVELRARFDEDKNVRFARQLEKHGVHVAYGIVGVKTHCKCSLVVRRESDGLRSYAHIGTGNYHPGTAQLYTDCGLLTSDPAITSEIISLFNYLTGRSLNLHFSELIVAPSSMRRRITEMIDREIEMAQEGRPARIVAKMNQLEDRAIIRKLYEASRAGVRITLIVRGFCCLRPGVPGLSENIRVISIVGRYLEHSRIFYFQSGSEHEWGGDLHIGSPDWMARNIDERVEVLVPVHDHEARRRLVEILEVNLADRVRSWVLQLDGTYHRLSPRDEDDAQSRFRMGTFDSFFRLTTASPSASAPA